MPNLTVLEHVPERVMVVGAHPDDAEFSAGATLAKWIARGCEVTLVVCTDGAAGSGNSDSSAREVTEARRQEQEEAVQALGVGRLQMLGMPDGGLEDTAEFRGEIVRLIRSHQPETLLTHDPHAHKRFVHRDHRVVGEVVQDAVYPYARDRLHYPEQLQEGVGPHKVKDVLFFESDEPDSVVDVSGFVEAQAAALSLNQSQLEGIIGHCNPNQWLSGRAAEASQGHSFAHGEAYRRLLAPG